MKKSTKQTFQFGVACLALMLSLPLFTLGQNSIWDQSKTQPIFDSINGCGYRDYNCGAAYIEQGILLCEREGWWPTWFKFCLDGVYLSAYHMKNDIRLQYINRLDDALQKHGDALGELQPSMRLTNLLNRASRNFDIGDLSLSQLQCLDLINKLQYLPNRCKEDTTNLRAGILYLVKALQSQGKYEEALNWQEQVIRIKSEQATKNTIPWFHLEYNTMAQLYASMGEAWNAEAYYQKSLKDLSIAWKSTPQNKALFPNSLTVYQNIARFKLNQNQPDSAIYYLNYALKQGYANTDGLKAKTYTILAEANELKGHKKEAKSNLEKALNFSLKVVGPRHYETALTHKAIGDFKSRQKLYTEALVDYQHALQCFSPSLSAHDYTQNPELTGIYAQKQLFEVLDAKSKAIWALAEIQPFRIQYAELARQTGQLALALIDSLRMGFAERPDKFGLTELAYPIFERMIATNLLIAQADPRRAAEFRKQAWVLCERSKALVMQENLRLSAARESALPVEVQQELHCFAIEMAAIEKKIYEAQYDLSKKETSNLSILQQQLFDLKRKKNAIDDRYFAVLNALSPVAEPIDWFQVANRLEPNTTLVSYFWGDKTLFIFGVSTQGTGIWSCPIDTALFSTIAQLHESLANPSRADDAANGFKSNAATLYTQLLGPVLDSLSLGNGALVIIPDGPLGLIPFETLLTKDDGNGFDAFAYLLHKFSVQYVASAALLVSPTAFQAEWPTEWLSLFAGYAPEYGTQSPKAYVDATRDPGALKDNLDALPGAQKEVVHIAHLLGGEAFHGNSASESAFKSTANRFKILHLAMHGFLNPKNPLYSCLLFTQDKAQKTEDDVLDANEIYTMRLNAKLVVLSACHSGAGLTRRGEGVQSLGWAFANAGVPATVQSLWAAEDASTVEITTAFYQNLKKGMHKPEALRQAKLQWLSQHEGSEANPAKWATLVSYGDPSPLFLSGTELWFLTALFVLIGTLIGAIFKHPYALTT